MTSVQSQEAFIRAHTERICSPNVPEILLHLVTENCDMWTMNEEQVAMLGISSPFWGFVWPGGHALARYLLDHPHIASKKTVLDIGTGAGIVAIAAALCGARRVIANDIDKLALVATQLNCELNHVKLETNEDDLVGTDNEDWDLIVAADMCYDSELTKQMASWLHTQTLKGKTVLFADPNRGWLQKYPVKAIAQYETPCDIDCRGHYLQTTFVYSFCENSLADSSL